MGVGGMYSADEYENDRWKHFFVKVWNGERAKEVWFKMV